MNLKKFITSILPSFEKGRLVEDVALMKTELNETVVPPYAEAMLQYNNRKLRAKSTQNFDREFQSAVKNTIRGDYIAVCSKVFKDVSENYDELETLVNKNFGRDVSASGMTYLKGNLIQYMEVLSFAMRFSRRLLSWTLAEELKAVDAQTNWSDPLTKAEKDWFWNNRHTFYKCMKVLYTVKGDLGRKLAVVPDMIIQPEEVELVTESVGRDKIDPLQMGIIPIALNPIYHIRMAVAEWQVSRHKAAQEEKKALEYRLLALKEANEGKRDAKLQQAIEYTEGRIQKLNRKLAEMEEDLNG